MQLKPVLGPVQLIFYSVGVIVGAGVYSVLGATAGLAQHNLWISFLIGATVALLTAISYAEIATAFPASVPSFSSAGLRPRLPSPWRSAGIYASSSICPRR